MLGPLRRGEKVNLEPPEVGDLPALRAWLADYDAVPYLGPSSVRSLAQLESWYEQVAGDEARIQWRIAAAGRVVGMTHLAHVDYRNRHATGGVVIGERAERGKGYAGEAVRLRAAFAFEELGLERLESETFAENVPMQRALERAGYRRIGTRHRYYYRGGRWHDVSLFELLRDEWGARGS